MGKKRTPQTSELYAKHLYMANRANGDEVHLYNDVQIVDTRVRAFIDGVKWERRRMSKLLMANKVTRS